MMIRKKRKTRFEAFAQRFLVIAMAIFVIGTIGVSSLESKYTRDIQVLEDEIQTIQSDIDSLQLQKQKLASFTRINAVASSKGYTYKNDALAASNIVAGEDGQ